MNDPLKFKLFSVYGTLLYKDVLYEAWKHVKENKGCEGIDKVSIARFEKDLNRNLEEILSELKEKRYKPSPVARKYIPKKNGKLRPLGIPTIKDRIIQTALVSKLESFFEVNVFHDNSCGFRPNRSAELAIKKVVSRLDTQYFYVYDFDIKGYFDNIPHKKLMKVINKYVSDGTVLDMIWKWLKAGYMEDSIRYEQTSGTQQGGVISPLLANIYLNELDWELDKAGHQFVRYADDSIVFCRSEAELERAKELVHKVLKKLGLEIQEDKTDDIDFRKKDFDYLGFTFSHVRQSKRGYSYFLVSPSDDSIKKFKRDLKAKIKKSYTFSFEKWTEILNPILRGKYNYFLIANRVCREIKDIQCTRGKICHAVPYKDFESLDGYVRNRLRVAFSCRGKKHGGVKQGRLLTVKYNNRFFIEQMELTCGQFMLNQLYFPDKSVSDFCDFLDSRKKPKVSNSNRERFFRYALAK